MSASEDEDGEGNPVLHLRQISQSCGINRIRAMPQQPGIIAAWSENAQVQVC
jgi:ribosome assembly protein RRB1